MVNVKAIQPGFSWTKFSGKLAIFIAYVRKSIYGPGGMKKPAMPRHIGPWPAIRCLCLCAVVLADVRPGNGLQDNTPNLATIIATFEFAQHPPPNCQTETRNA